MHGRVGRRICLLRWLWRKRCWQQGNGGLIQKVVMEVEGEDRDMQTTIFPRMERCPPCRPWRLPYRVHQRAGKREMEENQEARRDTMDRNMGIGHMVVGSEVHHIAGLYLSRSILKQVTLQVELIACSNRDSDDGTYNSPRGYDDCSLCAKEAKRVYEDDDGGYETSDSGDGYYSSGSERKYGRRMPGDGPSS
ncbi:hypothetical protein BDN72DRAFT_311510 [Pluteus cervinus]|uniref:Uncharacterized protein n=1 Tax=Pluteus cervinus TaxID=181527 RepID=A0ACD3AD59_9AGAR|nr:hypothetical protein BDN72DRAFT_311510 [Pluteus cervinus]